MSSSGVYLYASGHIQASADIPIVESADNSSIPTETQQATCQVVTEKLVATASATVTHALKGVCATKDLEKYFSNLQIGISSQLSTITYRLSKIHDQLDNLQETVLQNSNNDMEYSDHFTSKKMPRDSEVSRLNNTVHHNEQGVRIYSYYWRIGEFNSKITQPTNQVPLRSPSFYINQTYRMYVKLVLHQERGNIYIHVGLTQGEADSQLWWPFELKHQVTVLDQNDGLAEDLASRVWDPTTLCSPTDWQQPISGRDSEQCVGFGFSQETIFTKKYIYDNSIIIRLDVFLS